jgi:uncharacterized protein YecE (DUF72 family)
MTELKVGQIWRAKHGPEDVILVGLEHRSEHRHGVNLTFINVETGESHDVVGSQQMVSLYWDLIEDEEEVLKLKLTYFT